MNKLSDITVNLLHKRQPFRQRFTKIQILFISANVFNRSFFPRKTFLHQLIAYSRIHHSVFYLPWFPFHKWHLRDSHFLEAVLGCCFDTPAYASGICPDVCVKLFVKSNEVPAIVVIEKQYGVSVTCSSTLRKKLRGHALPSTPAADLVVIGRVKVLEDFSSHLSLYPFHCGEESETRSTHGNMRPSGYHAWDD